MSIPYIPLTDQEKHEILLRWGRSFVASCCKKMSFIESEIQESSIQSRIAEAVENDRKSRGDDWDGCGWGPNSPKQQAESRMASLTLDMEKQSIAQKNNDAMIDFLERSYAALQKMEAYKSLVGTITLLLDGDSVRTKSEVEKLARSVLASAQS